MLLVKLVLIRRSCSFIIANNWSIFFYSEIEEDMELPSFHLATIVKATDNFSSNNKLGQGGFGPVYKVYNNVLQSWVIIYYEIF